MSTGDVAEERRIAKEIARYLFQRYPDLFKTGEGLATLGNALCGALLALIVGLTADPKTHLRQLIAGLEQSMDDILAAKPPDSI